MTVNAHLKLESRIKAYSNGDSFWLEITEDPEATEHISVFFPIRQGYNNPDGNIDAAKALIQQVISQATEMLVRVSMYEKEQRETKAKK